MWEGPNWTFLVMELKQAMLTLKNLISFLQECHEQALVENVACRKIDLSIMVQLKSFYSFKIFFRY